MKKRILSIVLAICLVLSCVPVTVFAANADATELQNKLNSGGTVTLSKDYTIDTTLKVKKTVTLDLNGHTITMTGSGSVIEVAWSNLTLQDSSPTATHTDASLPSGGVITGGNADEGGGVRVGANGSMTMNGGTIENCSAGYGGGVAAKAGSFTMNGGTIANCNSTNLYDAFGGGGVYLAKTYTFTMNGGTIENCSSTSSGGGVFSNGDFSMSGNAIIRGCSAKSGGGARVHDDTFTMTGGTIEACTSTSGESDAVVIGTNVLLLANGGIVKGTALVANFNSAINTTSTDSYTKFYNEVTNYGTISGGVYYGGIKNEPSGTVSGTYHTVSFDSNGGSSVPTQRFVNTDKAPALQPANPTKDGYQAFDGWYNGDAKYDFNLPVTQTITLKTKFSNPKTYNISYNLAGGTATNPATYTVESDAITLNNPVKTGYTFTGWSGTGLTGENNMTVTIAKGSTGDRTYTAHFSQNNYTVAFNTVGGSSISDKTGVKWTDTVLSGITAPTKNGWEFIGWKCGDKTVNVNTKYSDLVANDTVTSVTLVAQWKDAQKPVITGLENNKTYCDAVEFEVTDNDGVASVKAGNTTLTPGTNGKYTLAKGIGTVTIVATDKAKNETTITVTVNDGHTYGEWQSNGNNTHTRYCTVTGCYGYEDGFCTGGQATYFKKAVCDICHAEYGELLTDSTAPTGEITVGTNKWNSFLNTITFGLFFKNTQSVAITATDDSYNHNGYTDDKAVKVEYYLYSGDTVLTQADLAGVSFTAYSGTFNINPDNKYVIYTRLTDHAGNVTYISSNGVVLDATAPVITGVENGKTYCEAQTVTVTEEYIESVKVNGTEVTLDDNNQFTLNPADGTQTIVVTDKAGNVSAEMIVTVNDGHTDENKDHKCDFCNENVGVHKDTDKDHACDYGCSVAIGEHKDEDKDHACDYGCSETIGVHEDTNNDHNCDYCSKEMTTCLDDDKDHICDICEAELSEHSGGEATCVDKAICEYCNAEYGEIDSTNHNLEKIPAKDATVTETGNDEHWHCLDCGKYFADENGTNEIKLVDTVISKLSPEIIEGEGQSITQGEVKELTFRSNAAFGDFIRVELDGVTVDADGYTAIEGSTIIILKADYVSTLSIGEHTISIVSESGNATTTFTVNAKAEDDTNQTDDSTTNPTQPDDSATAPEQPDDSTTEPAKTDDTTKPSQTDNSMTSPQTGNDEYACYFAILLALCDAGIIIAFAYKRRKQRSK